jgi:hypothetical protein
MQEFARLVVNVMTGLLITGVAHAEVTVGQRDDDLRAAEHALLYQRTTGGWPKNYDRKQELMVSRDGLARKSPTSAVTVIRGWGIMRKDCWIGRSRLGSIDSVEMSDRWRNSGDRVCFRRLFYAGHGMQGQEGARNA